MDKLQFLVLMNIKCGCTDYWWRSRRWRRETPSWSGVLWWACMSVQITNICAYCLWPWLASLATLRHVYFWFCGWRHACYNSSNGTSDAGLADAETDSPEASPDRMQSLLFMIALFHSGLHKKRCILSASATIHLMSEATASALTILEKVLKLDVK